MHPERVWEEREMTGPREGDVRERKGTEIEPPKGGGGSRFDISIYPSWCKDCGICVEFCTKKVFDRDVLGSPLISRPEECNGCLECVLHCPDFAIQVVKGKTGPKE